MCSWNRHDSSRLGGLLYSGCGLHQFGAHWQGREEIEAKQQELHATALRHSEMHISEWTSVSVGSESCSVHMNWEMKGGNARKRRGLLSLVLVSEAGRWRVAAAHNSDTLPVLS